MSRKDRELAEIEDKYRKNGVRYIVREMGGEKIVIPESCWDIVGYQPPVQESSISRMASLMYSQIQVPESPETAIARQDPVTAAELLARVSKDRLATEALRTADSMAKEYLSRLPEGRYNRSNGIRARFSRERRVFSGKDTDFTIEIELT